MMIFTLIPLYTYNNNTDNNDYSIYIMMIMINYNYIQLIPSYIYICVHNGSLRI